MTRTRISRRTREQAALICAVCASADEQSEDSAPTATSGRHLDTLWSSVEIARRAWRRVRAAAPALPSPEQKRAAYAEAEALLRCGWSPGDEL